MLVFQRVFSENMITTISENKNKYAGLKRQEERHKRPWWPATNIEVRSFLGVLLYMGLHTAACIEDYCSRADDTPVHAISKVISMARFQQLKRYIHVCDPHGDNVKSVFFGKVEPLFGHIRETCKSVWTRRCRVSVDEMMVTCMGRCLETVRVKNKPIGQGFKLWALRERGYVFDFSHIRISLNGGACRSITDN